MIRFRNFEKSYSDRLIISAPDLALDEPLYWLRGGNGSGKTTLLKSMAGLIPFKGKITVGGKDIRSRQLAYRRAVNYAPAEPLYPEFLTGADLIAFYREAKGGSPEQVTRLTRCLGVHEYMRHKTGTYSTGMTKKLSLVLAFIGSPELVLLDEPLITLDTASVAALMGLMEAHCGAGVRLLITSHQDVPPVFSRTPVPLFIRDKILTLEP